MSATTTPPATTGPKSTIENWLLFLGVVLGAASTFFTSSQLTVFGLSPFLLAVVAAAMAKALPSLAQDVSSVEDWVLFLSVFFGAVSSGFANDPAYATWGVIFGFLVKAVLSFRGVTKANVVEDVFLALSVIIAGIAQIYGNADLTNLALFIAALSKAIPGLSGASLPGTTAPAPAPTS